MTFSEPLTVVLDVIAWAAIHTTTGYLVHRLPRRWFERDTFLTRARWFEQDGRVYVDALRIKRWKKWLPEAGAFFEGGFDKRVLRSFSTEYLHTYLRETRRAELGHWLAAAAAPLFFFWNPWPVAVFMLLYAATTNGPCVASQRYNRIRIVRVLLTRARYRPR